MPSYLDEIAARRQSRDRAGYNRDTTVDEQLEAFRDKDERRVFQDGASLAELALADVGEFAKRGHMSPHQVELAETSAIGQAFVTAERDWQKRNEERREAKTRDPSRPLGR